MVTGNWEASTTIKGYAWAYEFGVAGENGCHRSGYSFGTEGLFVFKMRIRKGTGKHTDKVKTEEWSVGVGVALVT